METIGSVIVLGFVFGLKHALEADHVAAVASLATERPNLRGSALVGAWWGLGHTAALLVAGIAVITLRLQISEELSAALELCVAATLVFVGGDVLWKLARSEQVHLHVHRHGERVHVHPHTHGHAEAHAHAAIEAAHHGVPGQRRPFLVGIVHGLAGSAALMLLVASAIPSPPLAMAYIGAFGIGSIGGMVAMSALVGLPAAFTARRYNRANVMLRTAAGAFSLCFGLLLAYRIVS